MTHIILRVLAAAFTLAAIFILVTAKQSVVLFGITFQARYDYASVFRLINPIALLPISLIKLINFWILYVFRFVLGADAVVCGFSLLSILFVCILSRSESHAKTHFFLYLHDLVR